MPYQRKGFYFCIVMLIPSPKNIFDQHTNTGIYGKLYLHLISRMIFDCFLALSYWMDSVCCDEGGRNMESDMREIQAIDELYG